MLNMATILKTNLSDDRFTSATVVESSYLFRVEPPSKATYSWRKAAFKKRTRPAQPPPKCRMPVQVANGYSSDHMPSFPPTLEENLEAVAEPQHDFKITPEAESEVKDNPSQHFLEKAKPHAVAPNINPLHLQRDSSSTTASDSTSSSPTTTVSLTESYNTGDTPITSPDTPASTQSLSSHSFNLAASSHPLEKPDHFRLAPAPKNLSRPSTSGKKPRNLKNLAVDTTSATAFGRAVNTASLPLHRDQGSNMLSPPVSPAVVKPPKQPKRKVSNLGLSIVTPSSNSPPVQQILEVPPTPSLVKPHALRHFPSSPSLPLPSPSKPPEGGMRLPPLATRRSVNVGFAEAPQEKDEDEPNFDVPQSAEPKPKSYPDGPICIYDPHVYLYYEPNAEEASQFDVVLNVASEVKNPFASPSGKEESSNDKENTSMSEPSSPDTPKPATTIDTSKLPRSDYIHIPWEHNTDIVPDLYDLVKLVDEHVQEGKKVLIHCQCGVSRSASLIVAYGLYKNPSMTVQEAYDAVKRRSKWISPNMNLIMQLQEFRSELLKQSAGMPNRGISHRHQTSKSKIAPLAAGRTNESPSQTQDREQKNQDLGPRSAPLPPEDNKNRILSIATASDAVTPGPSSAPSGFSWPIDQASTPTASETSISPRNNSLQASSLSLPPISLNTIQEISSPSSQTSAVSSRPSHSTQSSSQVSPEQAQPPWQTGLKPDSSHTRAHPIPKSITLPERINPRLNALALGHDRSTDSPRSAEFAMNSAKPPTPDETFGLTSPRISSFQSLHSSLHPSPPQAHSLNSSEEPVTLSTAPRVPQQQPHKPKLITPSKNLSSLAVCSQPLTLTTHHEEQSSFDSLTSPRSSEFAMTGIVPPKTVQNEDNFGLTSPRENLSFAQQLQFPHRNSPPSLYAPPNKREAAFAGLHSPVVSTPKPFPPTSMLNTGYKRDDGGASDRRNLRSRLGMSTSSSYDMRSEYVLAAKARELASQPTLAPSPEHRESFVQATQDDMSDALLSPRATEFTKNPFADILSTGAAGEPTSCVVSGGRTEATEEKDPRSPVQKAGSSPIVRNIADAFS